MRLFEQHLVVSDLKRSAVFYEEILGFQLGLNAGEILFYWIDPSHHSMLGLWQKGKSNNPFGPDTSQVLRQHLAFEVPKERFHETVQMLKNSNVQINDFFGEETEEGSVHPWTPIVSVYFSDPDGHVLEILSKLPDEPRPNWNPMSFSEWRQRLESE
ncbi:glyoxalase [Marinithermofilum abyssi]|uniref:Glyoxalase n=1 Tax=Marinithermofilum abyssi TaxID=1571185 RepID=A0A8J2VEZ5_9BACL|nr:VOC family protein [Marinithermofilum abyssi]GGE03353.1 glyoxalase [Marinithermofilum abyssi]